MTTAATIRTRAWVEQIMGMPISVHIRAADPDRADIADAVGQVFDHLRRVDAVFSTWNVDSELMRIRAGRLDPADADRWIGEVAVRCRAAGDATGGLFTTDLVGPDGSRGWDPTGLVKGWAVGAAADHLRGVDGIGFSVNAGGDIVCGPGSDSDQFAMPWRIGIQDPARPDRIADVVEIVTGALATSGTGARGDHIMDPRTNVAVHRDHSTTVTGPNLMWADIWATAAFVDTDVLADRLEWENYSLIVTRPSTVR